MSTARIADFFFELGTMRKLARMHRQLLITDDISDNIASHSFRVAMIGWVLAKEEGADPYKVMGMCLVHDLGEIRSGDHNWLHKRYVKIDETEITRDQLGSLPHQDMYDLATEYEARQSAESVIAKDADLTDQILLLREYAHQGNREAQIWLDGKRSGEGNTYIEKMQTTSAKKIAGEIMNSGPSDWWKNLWTSESK